MEKPNVTITDQSPPNSPTVPPSKLANCSQFADETMEKPNVTITDQSPPNSPTVPPSKLANCSHFADETMEKPNVTITDQSPPNSPTVPPSNLANCSHFADETMEKPNVTITDQSSPNSPTVPPSPLPQPASEPACIQGGAYPPPPPADTPYATAPPTTVFVPNYGATNTVSTPPTITIGNCPTCRVGILQEYYTCLGFLCAVLFYPLGTISCPATRFKRCSYCFAWFC